MQERTHAEAHLKLRPDACILLIFPSFFVHYD
ncbi:hypothetical protein T11_13575 [Trichinella zimbabwensis]|uniref:Uncharacterized protein n=1 Tax=Trichinella zimbabwensis TaxID=268475 RepID=A0A0V1GHK3_9BILA|nr:hypothetical protein T11_13575 [Trichinella zimbabwensis]